MAKILLIAGYPYSLVNFRGRLIEAMIAHGHEVHAAGPPADARTLDWLAERSVDYHEVPFDRAGFAATRDVGAFLTLWRIMRDVRPDAVFAYTIKPVIYGLLAAASAGVKQRFALVTGVGFAFNAGDPSLKRSIARVVASRLYALALRFATAVFFQNPDDARLFRENNLLPATLDPIVVNGSGVDLEYFAATPVPKVARFLMIGRLIADKGVREFIAAARLVKGAHPSAIFDLVGSCDANPTTIPADLISAAAREGVIMHHGEIDDVRPFLSAASVFVLPSYGEGLPRTVLEAMSTGRAIVTTDAPGCRETVVDGENGFIVPVRNIEALAQAMERFIRDPLLSERMGRRSRELCEEKYDVNKINNELLRHMALDREDTGKRCAVEVDQSDP